MHHAKITILRGALKINLNRLSSYDTDRPNRWFSFPLNTIARRMNRTSIFDFIGNLDTLLAVMLGALLATGGALVAELIQDRLGRRRRQRDASRFFAEILTSVDQIFLLACESMKVGDPWGNYTRTLFEIASREASIYERNRERLFDIQDMQLRFALHGHMLRFTVPIFGILENCEQIEALQTRLDEDEALSVAVRAFRRVSSRTPRPDAYAIAAPAASPQISIYGSYRRSGFQTDRPRGGRFHGIYQCHARGVSLRHFPITTEIGRTSARQAG
jgi:hypothetical protein